MNKTTGIVIAGIVALLIGGVAYAALNSGNEMMDEKIDTSPRMGDSETMVENGDDKMMDQGEGMMKSGSYEAYSTEKLARAETGDVVLFFHASWCPSCRGLDADIEKNLGTIPSGVSILQVDYDTESELKKKYEVTYQHTLVQVAADGTMIKKWSGSPTLASVVSQIN